DIPTHATTHGSPAPLQYRRSTRARPHRPASVYVQGQPDLVDGLPERLPGGMPHGIHVPRAGELDAAQPHLRHAVDLRDSRADVAIGQAGEADLAVGIVAAEVHQPVVVDPEHLARRLVVA